MKNNVLLLNDNFSPIAFISERKAIRLMVKEKATVISVWDDIEIAFSSGSFRLPAVLKMNYQIHKRYTPLAFSRLAVLKRDSMRCQYCSKDLSWVDATLDHIIPKKFGGGSSFINCVASCKRCNLGKGGRYLHETNMKLIREPIRPSGFLFAYMETEAHPDWECYLKKA